MISCSWELAETMILTEQTMNQESTSRCSRAAHLGVKPSCVAAGDDGSSDAISDGNAHTDFPSSSPYAAPGRRRNDCPLEDHRPARHHMEEGTVCAPITVVPRGAV